MNRTTEILIKARELLITKGWTTLVAARDSEGARIGALQPEACKFCSLGALERAEFDSPYWTASPNYSVFPSSVKILRRAIIEKTGCKHIEIADFNDLSESVEPVLAAFDRAIELSKQN